MNDLLLKARYLFVSYLLPLQINSIHALNLQLGQQELKKMAINDHFLAINDHDIDPHVENR